MANERESSENPILVTKDGQELLVNGPVYVYEESWTPAAAPTDAQPSWLEIRPDHRGEFDELVARGVDVHMEMLDANELFVCLQRGSRQTLVRVSARGKLTVTTEEA